MLVLRRYEQNEEPVTTERCERIKTECLGRISQVIARYKKVTGRAHPQEAILRQKCIRKYNKCMAQLGRRLQRRVERRAFLKPHRKLKVS
ncbi:MAG: hypothetical protein K6T73_01280 [Candidatus Bathyarchaeota archaeon]|nr:hypothetical protein [Candidatus Bathyarchaeota archaeon]